MYSHCHLHVYCIYIHIIYIMSQEPLSNEPRLLVLQTSDSSINARATPDFCSPAREPCARFLPKTRPRPERGRSRQAALRLVR